MKSKYLVKLSGHEQAGHVLAKSLRVGDAVTAYTLNQDGTKTLFSGRVERVLAEMPTSRRERFDELQLKIGFSDEMMARLVKVGPDTQRKWTEGRVLIPPSCLELARVALWLQRYHPEAWEEWTQRLNRQRPSDGDGGDE